MGSSKTVFGGEARASLGLEVPIADRLFVSAQVMYRMLITENSVRNESQETLYAAFLNIEPQTSDKIEDAHFISLLVGAGMGF